MNNLGRLSAELISLILDHVNHHDLYTCTLINKPFYSEAMPLLWRRLDIDNQDKLINMTRAMTSSSSSHSPGDLVRFISVTCMLYDVDLLVLAKHSPLLEHLVLKKAHMITDASFLHVSRYCPYLKTVHLKCAFSISKVSMIAFGQHCHLRLRVLKLKYCRGLDADLFMALGTCRFLKEITIINCDLNLMKKNDDNLDFIKKIALTLTGFHHLTLLRIKDDDATTTNDYTPFITAATTITCSWPHLTHLHLDACRTLDDTKAMAFFQTHPQLICLELCNTNITDITLDAIATYLPEIRDVRVLNNRRLTHAGIRRLVKTCHKLIEGVSCAGCCINAQDFDDLDQYTYDLAFAEYGFEVIWLAGDAFNNRDDDTLEEEEEDDDDDDSENSDLNENDDDEDGGGDDDENDDDDGNNNNSEEQQ